VVERKRDEYGRLVYEDHEVPPISDEIAVWRGRATVAGQPAPGTTTRMHLTPAGRDTCVEGWVRSDRWWLHCAFHRPYRLAGEASQEAGE
jgi:hypothetical protein